MQHDDRRHRVLSALRSCEPVRLRDVRRVVFTPGEDWRLEKAKTWSALCQLADDGLVTIGRGCATLKPIGLQVLTIAERAWDLVPA